MCLRATASGIWWTCAAKLGRHNELGAGLQGCFGIMGIVTKCPTNLLGPLKNIIVCYFGIYRHYQRHQSALVAFVVCGIFFRVCTVQHGSSLYHICAVSWADPSGNPHGHDRS